ncbi:tetratricopeptide repeat protein [Actinoplanes campanulatus]|uniref:tetratricopeptide repeat protein n=3 Tax=Actinoplanes campanulatus TaxID=113559 RepID=UPI001E61A232|nr:tetratricopeptide repeat protein [Actinoplanes campanulatus]
MTGLVLDAAGFEVLVAGKPVDARRPLEPADIELLQGVAAEYVDAVHSDADDAVFVALGRKLFAWIGGDEVQFRTPLVFEVRASASPSAAEWAVLRAPWEVLADQHGFLAADELRRFEVVRRLGPPDAAPALDGFRLGLMFMASAPRGQHELDFEAEESAILTAVGDTRVDLVVEDTGDPDQLGQRWADLGGLPVLHLSCHGVNNWRISPDRPGVPVLMMEDEIGDGQPVTAADLVRRLPVMPRLMFVSACLTATAADADGYLPPGPDHRSTDTTVSETSPALLVPVAHSLSTGLVTAGVPAVVGWDGSVTDGAATLFAQHLYQQLGRRQNLAAAVGDARRELLACKQPRLRADWHLARIWLGPTGGGPVVAGTRKRPRLSAQHGRKTFLDLKRRHVPVATAQMFVGRRREMRQSLRALRGNEHSGVLLHGQGHLGKSSLAARLTDRFTDRAVAVVYGDYTAMGMLDAIAAAVEDNPAARSLIEARRAEVRDQPEALRWVLVDLLSGPCAQVDDNGQRPLLLIIDDLEQILEPQPDALHRVVSRYAPALAAALRAFDPDRGDSRLVVTSRFIFALDGLEDQLDPVQLAPLSPVAQQKLAVRQRAVPAEALRESRAGLAARAIAVSRGNPGLQDLVALRLVYSPQVDAARAEQAVAEMESYLDRGDLPADADVRPFVEDLALDALIEQAGPTHIALLRALTLFELPMPTAVTTLLEARTHGSVQRLCGLGLADAFPDIRDPGDTATAVSPLAAGRLTPLTDSEQSELAGAVVQPLQAAWSDSGTRHIWDPDLDLQLTRLAVLADDPLAIESCAAGAVHRLLAGPAEQALMLGQQSIAILDRHVTPVPLLLLRRTAEAAQTTGEGDTAARLYDRAMKQATDSAAATDPLEQARVIGEHARLLFTRGDPERAEQLLYQARDIFTAAGSDHEAAATWGSLAQILYQRGSYDEALRIRREVELPVYERLGDTRSIALAWGSIADILYQRGEYDEALRIRRERQLPAFERIGDIRSTALTWGSIADILHRHNEYDEALRIRREVELPVYERLGDTRSIAITWGNVADILHQRGEYDEALRIRRERQLPVYERLGDTRSIAITWGNVADILHQRGEYDEALRIRRERQLPAYERLGDIRSTAVAWGNIADILHQRGEYDEELRIRREVELPAYERLGDTRSTAIAWGNLARILRQHGDHDEALRIYREKTLPAFERLGDPRSAAITWGSIADILHQYGDHDEELRIRREVELPAYERLGDARSAAITWVKVAEILQVRGEYDEALRIHRERALPAFERLGDPRSTAITWGSIADILHQRGDYDEELRIRCEVELPAYERLGDARSTALTWGNIADIRYQRGDYDEALRIRQENSLPAFKRMNDPDAIASSIWGIARIQLQLGQFDSALPNLVEAFQILDQLQRPDGIAIVGGTLGQLLITFGDLDTARNVLAKSHSAAQKVGLISIAEEISEMLRTADSDTRSTGD